MTPEQVSSYLQKFYGDPTVVTAEIVLGYWMQYETENWEHGILGTMRDATGSNVTSEQLATISASTLLLWGEKDPLTPLLQGQQLQRMLPHAILTVIPDAGHLPMEEFPVQSNNMILNFLEGDKL